MRPRRDGARALETLLNLRPSRRAGLLAAGLLTVIVLALLAAPTLCRLATKLIVVDDPLQSADFIYVLNGRIAVRAELAARVYHQGLAPQVLLAHTRETVPPRFRPDRTLSELILTNIVARGVPASAAGIIPFPGGVVNTRDEARALRQHLERQPARRVIVVTADYHTGRARRTLRQELRGLRVELYMAAAPDDRGITPHNWWERKEGILRYTTELVKQLGAIVQHAARTR